jgi:hypothetical protein
MSMRLAIVVGLVLLTSGSVGAQVHPDPSHGNAPGTSSGVFPSLDSLNFRESLHMKMTALRKAKPGDRQRVQNILEAARSSLSKYVDYHTAERDGYRPVLTPVNRSIYHFTNYYNWRDSERVGTIPFSAQHPTSLIYSRRGDQYKLIGVMYTAPATDDEEALDRRIPLSVAQWHAHVNVCMPPPGEIRRVWEANSLFGKIGSIATRAECEKAEGRFLPQIYGWMVHMYLFERKPEEVWSVDRILREESLPPENQ